MTSSELSDVTDTPFTSADPQSHTSLSYAHFYYNFYLNDSYWPDPFNRSLAQHTDDPLEGLPYPSLYGWARIVLSALVVTLIMLVIVIGNGLVIVAIVRDRHLTGLQNWFIASLAVSDLLVGLFVMPLTLAYELMGYWAFGEILCDLWLSTDVLLCTASILNLVLISLDRYWSITRALTYLRLRTRGAAGGMVAAVWGLSMVVSLPPLVGWKGPQPTKLGYPLCVLSEEPGYVIYSTMGSFYLPLVVMVLVYFKIYLAARGRARRYLNKGPLLPQKSLNTPVTLEELHVKSVSASTTTTSLSAPYPQHPRHLPLCPHSGGAASPRGRTGRQFVSPDVSPAVETVEGRMMVSEIGVQRRGGEVGDSGRDELCSEGGSQPGGQEDEGPERGKGGLSHQETAAIAADLKHKTSNFSSQSASSKLTRHARSVKIQDGGGADHVSSDADRFKRRLARARERRATLVLGIVMASFIGCWLPFFSIYPITLLVGVQIHPILFAIIFWLGYCNSALNPIIYTIFNREFRQAFQRILSSWRSANVF